MKKSNHIIEDILSFIPVMIAVLVMCVYGLFEKEEDFDPYI